MSSTTRLFLMFLLFIAWSAEAAKTSIEAAKLLEAVAITARAQMQASNSLEEPDDVKNELESKDKAEDMLKTAANKDTSTNDVKSEYKHKELSIGRHRVFQQYCANAVPETGDRKLMKGRTLELLASHIFTACLTYECRWVLKLPGPVCDVISNQAKILQKKAKKYKHHLYIKGLRKRAANALYILA